VVDKVVPIGAAAIANQDAFAAITEAAEVAVARGATDLVIGMKLRDQTYYTVTKGRADASAMLSLLLREQALGMLDDGK